MAREEIIGDARLILGDCRDVLPTLGKVDAVVTDPPYGIGMDGGNVGYKGFNDFAKLGWDGEAPQDVISRIVQLGVPYIIWGGNYFDLPPARCYLVWDKGAGFKNRSYAESELALTNLDQNARTLTYDPLARGDYRGKLHPTQKPLSLMKWCIQQLPKTVDRICDHFMGSGSTGCAAVQLGKSFIGIEREPSYFDVACRRIQKVYDQPDFLVERPAPPKQEAML